MKKLLPASLTRAQRMGIIIIVLFHAVGFVGFMTPSIDVWFLRIVPWHLLLMAGVITYNHDRPDVRFLLFALMIFIIGFMAEFIGVHTGLLFGKYNYGETLGFQLFNIPLIIGVNWFLLIYSTGVFIQRSRIQNKLLRILAGAGILVVLDMLIEPIAIQFDYWHWAANSIPVENYICWFLLSALMLFIFDRFNFKTQSMVPPALLIMQFVFFMALGIAN